MITETMSENHKMHMLLIFPEVVPFLSYMLNVIYKRKKVKTKREAMTKMLQVFRSLPNSYLTLFLHCPRQVYAAVKQFLFPQTMEQLNVQGVLLIPYSKYLQKREFQNLINILRPGMKPPTFIPRDILSCNLQIGSYSLSSSHLLSSLTRRQNRNDSAPRST